MEWYYERLDRPPPPSVTFLNTIRDLKTRGVPLGINFFHPSGFILGLKASHIRQEGDFIDPFGNAVSSEDEFWLVDGSIGYRFPKRLGLISIRATNLLDEKFKFEDIDPANPTLYPERLILGQITLAF